MNCCTSIQDRIPCIYISQNDSGDLRGVAGGNGELGCLCGKAGTSHLYDGSAHSSGCVVNGLAVGGWDKVSQLHSPTYYARIVVCAWIVNVCTG